MDHIEQSVKSYILETFLPGTDAAELQSDTPLVSGGILDSLATVKLVMHLEEQFKIEIAAHEATTDNLDSIALIASLVRSKQTA
jgi:acyl carrier protein